MNSGSGGSLTTRGGFESYLYKFFAENEKKKVEKANNEMNKK